MSIQIGDLTISDQQLGALGLAPANSGGNFAAMAGGKPGLAQELGALGFLVVTGLLLPSPLGMRFALLVLALYALTHAKTVASITNYIMSGFTTITGL